LITEAIDETSGSAAGSVVVDIDPTFVA